MAVETKIEDTIPEVEEIIPDAILDSEVYKKAIENLAANKDPHIFDNANPEHAAIVLGNILKNSNEKVQIFAGDFNGNVSDNEYYLVNLTTYLNKNKPLYIIFENQPNPDSLALKLIKQYPTNPNISIFILKEDTGLHKYPHFTIGDGRMFRMETEKKQYKAICSFNNKEIVQAFEKTFRILLGESEPLTS